MPAPARIWLGSCRDSTVRKAPEPSDSRATATEQPDKETISRPIGTPGQAAISILTHCAWSGAGVPDNKIFPMSDTVFNAESSERDVPHGELPSTIGMY